jgi:hypothetical protein
VNDLSTGRGEMGTAGTQTAALAFGGNPPTTAATEEWTKAVAIQTITAS